MCIDVVCAVCFWFFCIICSRSEHMDTCKWSFAQLTRPLHSLLCVYRVSTLFSSIRSLTTPQHTRHIFATWSADFANFHPPTLWLIFILNLIWSKPVSCVDSLLLTFVRASLWHYFFDQAQWLPGVSYSCLATLHWQQASQIGRLCLDRLAASPCI